MLNSLRRITIINKQPGNTIKTIKLSLKISDHDLETKTKQMRKFLEKGNKVRIIIQLKGRENYHSERAYSFGERLVKDFQNFAIVEQAPKLNGNSMTMLFRCKK